MIELTLEQVQALNQPNGSLPRVVNPRTQELYVLMPLAEYERLAEDEEIDAGPWSEEERDLLREKACRMLDVFGNDP